MLYKVIKDWVSRQPDTPDLVTFRTVLSRDAHIISSRSYVDYLEICRQSWAAGEGITGLPGMMQEVDALRVILPVLYSGGDIQLLSPWGTTGMTGVTQLKLAVRDLAAISGRELFAPDVRRLILFYDTRQPDKVPGGLAGIRRLFPSCEQLIRIYGRSACAFASAIHHIPLNGAPEERNFAGKLTRPGSAVILDKRMNPLPADMAGDIYLHSDLSHLSADERLADGFISHPHSPGDYLFPTGEKGRLLRGDILEILKSRSGEWLIDGIEVRQEEIEKLVLATTTVPATPPIPATGPANPSWRLPVFAQTTCPRDPAYGSQLLTDRLGPWLGRDFQWVPLHDFPLNASGRIDEAKLSALSFFCDE